MSLESCIFSGNHSENGGAVYVAQNGTLSVKGCTFYGNRVTNNGGAIITWQPGPLTLEGNLFYGNTAASYPAVGRYNSPTITSLGYNVVDAALGTGTTESGFAASTDTAKPDTGDVSVIPVTPMNFKLLSDSAAAEVITSLPVDYPAVDFYGNPISASDTAPAAAGAVQAAVGGTGYYLGVSVNNSAAGSVNVSPEPDGEGLVSGAVTITATANSGNGYELLYWLVNGVNTGSENPLVFDPITAHTTVQAVFGKVIAVTDFTDSADGNGEPGTLRLALNTAGDGDIIRFTGVNAGTSVVQLVSALPGITGGKNITIEGNGITITPSSTWTAASPLLSISDAGTAVSVSRVHFKDGRQAAINNTNGNVSLESCIFSGNRSATGFDGGALYNGGTMSVKGCTFYGNNAGRYGGAIFSYGTLTLEGNLFYRNTGAGTSSYRVVYSSSGTVTSLGYNVVDVALGPGITQSGFATSTINPNTDKGSISGLPVSPVSFRLLSGSPAVNVIATRSEGYPTVDFYGDSIGNGAAAGAVQATASGTGYYLEVSVNNSNMGSVSVSPAPDADGLYSDMVEIEATATDTDYAFGYWLVNGVKDNSGNPLSLNNITAHTTVRAVFLGVIGAYIINQTSGNSAGDPVTLNPATVMGSFALGTMTAADSGWRQLLDDIAEVGKYVTLDLSDCTLPVGVTAFNPDFNVTTGKNRIVSITLPDTATSIPNGGASFAAFRNFTVLTSFSGAGLTSIGNSAFYQITSLTMTTLPSTLTSIGNDAFYGCTNLALTSLPTGVTSISEGAFNSCTNLALSSLPSGITSIGGRAFVNCTNLALTSLPTGVTSIGTYTFYGCTKLALTSLPTGVTSIGDGAFQNCTELTQITLPSVVITINANAFNGCTSLATVTCLAVSPPALANENAFTNTHANLEIKVPSDSVTAYQAATNWSSYADKISAIE